MRRLLSVANPCDFSWRNRLLAWEGALQILSEGPCLGAAGSEPESLYEQYYLSPKSNESAAFDSNDHLLLGVSLGIPAFVCFAVFVWLSLRRIPSELSQPDTVSTEGITKPFTNAFQRLDWSGAVFRSGAIVLAVGFWFDAGLFNLSTGPLFWMLMGLGGAA